MKKTTCSNCGWCKKDFFKENFLMPNVGFCDRFKEVTNLNEASCIGYKESTETSDYFRNLENAKKHNINLQQKLEL